MRRCAKFRYDWSSRCRDMAIYRFFLQNGGRPLSWIHLTHIWTTHEEHLMVFIDVQNLVGIDTVVSII